MVQLSHPYMTTGRTIALIRQTFVGKVACCGVRVLAAAVLGGMAAGISPFGEGHRYPSRVQPQAKLQGGSAAPPVSRKLD